MLGTTTTGAAGAPGGEVAVPDDERLTLVGLLFEAAEGVGTAMSVPLAEERLSGSEFEVLLRLSRSPQSRLRMSDLAAQTTLSTSGITRVVDRLERASLVERVACAGDRRGLYAALTAEGSTRVREILPGHLALIDELVTSQLTASEVDALARALRKVRDRVRPGAVQGADAAGR